MANETETSRQAFTEIDQGTLLALKQIWPVIEKGLPSILDQFYRHIASDPEIAANLEQDLDPDSFKQAQTRFWQSLFNDQFNAVRSRGYERPHFSRPQSGVYVVH